MAVFEAVNQLTSRKDAELNAVGGEMVVVDCANDEASNDSHCSESLLTNHQHSSASLSNNNDIYIVERSSFIDLGELINLTAGNQLTSEPSATTNSTDGQAADRLLVRYLVDNSARGDAQTHSCDTRKLSEDTGKLVDPRKHSGDARKHSGDTGIPGKHCGDVGKLSDNIRNNSGDAGIPEKHSVDAGKHSGGDKIPGNHFGDVAKHAGDARKLSDGVRNHSGDAVVPGKLSGDPGKLSGDAEKHGDAGKLSVDAGIPGNHSGDAVKHSATAGVDELRLLAGDGERRQKRRRLAAKTTDNNTAVATAAAAVAHNDADVNCSKTGQDVHCNSLSSSNRRNKRTPVVIADKLPVSVIVTGKQRAITATDAADVVFMATNGNNREDQSSSSLSLSSSSCDATRPSTSTLRRDVTLSRTTDNSQFGLGQL